MSHLRQVMNAFAHDPISLADRSPNGAVTAGTEVSLLLRVGDDMRGSVYEVWLETFDACDEYSLWRQKPMEPCNAGFSTVASTEGEPRVIYYRFRIRTDVGDVLYTSRSDGIASSGNAFVPNVGVDDERMPQGFQLTVYDKDFTVPDWFAGGVMYQVFPDRFARGPKGIRWEGVDVHRSHGWQIHVHEDWDEPPSWFDGYDPVDFFGGTFSGIESRLDYLASLGVSVLYLNPICEARSNHRYDTGDYEVPDSILGTWEDFERLVRAARRKGIRIILDTVLSHTGSSSKYFNLDSSYPTLGAAQGQDSPYREWYDFTPMQNGVPYRCWWGDATLPEINELDKSWQQYVLGDTDGVLGIWKSHGAFGYRLDVADEIPDEVLELIRKSVKTASGESVLIGEVWEDATTKVSYGKLRTYALGRSLDSVMNYPLRSALASFALGSEDAKHLATFLKMQRSNYPPPMYKSLMNLLSSHDVERIRSVLSLGREVRSLDRNDQLRLVSGITSNEDAYGAALQRMLATIIYTLPGVPCLYYGDERGMQGGRDPFDRATFPWSCQRSDCGQDLTWFYKNLGRLRNSYRTLKSGNAAFYSYGKDVLAILRMPDNDHRRVDAILTVVNRSDAPQNYIFDLVDPSSGLKEHDTVRIRYADERPRCIFSTDGAGVSASTQARCELGIFSGRIEPMQACVFNLGHGLDVPMPYGMGIICHISSIPHFTSSCDGGENAEAGFSGAASFERHAEKRLGGKIGRDAYRFVDLLAEAKVKYWQILPLNPTDEFGSPYAGLSAFAGNTQLLEDEYLDEAHLSCVGEDDLRRFVSDNREWLLPYATFAAVKKVYGERPWREWGKPYREWEFGLEGNPDIQDEVRAECLRQYVFDEQWAALRRYANERGVLIVGDMPIYVSPDSADVWAHRSYFNIDDYGNVESEGGFPPDNLSRDGQRWGSPTYNWEELRAHGYDWWLARFARSFKWYDFTRIDHFIGFSEFYSIPRGATAHDGRWEAGPGFELFERVFERFGSLPLIAEDLGIITPQVRQLLAQCGFAGMDVLQFEDGDARYEWSAKPAKISFTGTHDTQTLIGWLGSRFGLFGDDALQEAARLRKMLAESSANVVMYPLQDILDLDDSARMNTPGTTGGNWEWQADASEVEQALPKVKALVARRQATRRLWI